MSDFYEYTDKALKYLRRYFIRQFQNTEMMIQADSLNVISQTVELYDDLYNEAIRVFMLIARRKYKECGGTDTLEMAWLMGLLKESNPLTGYIFINDEDRKRQYYTEGILSGAVDSVSGKQRIPASVVKRESKKALRYLYGSVKQYADIVTDEAAMQAFSDTNTEFVEYITAKDEKVCEVCSPRDGKIYPLANAPKLPAHYNCRCYFVKVVK